MQIKKQKTPEFNKFVGKPNQPYMSLEKISAMHKACRGVMNSNVEQESLPEKEIIQIFEDNPGSFSNEAFESWGSRFHNDKEWDMDMIREGVYTASSSQLNLIALYIKNNLTSEKI